MSGRSHRKRVDRKKPSAGTAARKSRKRKGRSVKPPDETADSTDRGAAAAAPTTPTVAPDCTTPEFPCVCPGEKYPITHAVCLGRQEREYQKCADCRYRITGRRPRRDVLKEK